MINVADRADVDMGLCAFKFFCHFFNYGPQTWGYLPF